MQTLVSSGFERMIRDGIDGKGIPERFGHAKAVPIEVKSLARTVRFSSGSCARGSEFINAGSLMRRQ